MKMCELRKIIENMPDESDVRFVLLDKIPAEQLEKMSYAYPYTCAELCSDGYDIGYSDNCVSVYFKKCKEN